MKANWKAYQLRFFGISTSASLSAGSVFRASIHTDRTRCCHMARLAKRNASRASRVRRVAVRLKIAPEMVAERERLKMLYVFPARKSGKTGKGHISLSGLENCHNDVLEACKEKGRIIPFVLYDLRHTFATRAAQGECRCQRLRPSWDTLRCGRFRSTSTQHRTINRLRWIVSTESGRRASNNTASQCALRPTVGPRRPGIRGISTDQAGTAGKSCNDGTPADVAEFSGNYSVF